MKRFTQKYYSSLIFACCSICFLRFFSSCGLLTNQEYEFREIYTDTTEQFYYSKEAVNEFLTMRQRFPPDFYSDTLMNSVDAKTAVVLYIIPDSINHSTDDSATARHWVINSIPAWQGEIILKQTGTNEKYFQFFRSNQTFTVSQLYYRVSKQKYASIPKPPSVKRSSLMENDFLTFEATFNVRPISVQTVKEFSEYVWTTWKMTHTGTGMVFKPHIIDERVTTNTDSTIAYSLYEITGYQYDNKNEYRYFANKLTFNFNKQNRAVSLNTKTIRKYQETGK
ncbi:MAG: hypothetical protein WDA22_00115 [Bacteroidota bacterium]